MAMPATPSRRIVVLDLLSEGSHRRFAAMIAPGFELMVASARDDGHLRALIADADYAITGQVAVSADLLKAARRLRLLHKWGVGVDNIDLDAARSLGIPVARTSGGNAIPVAEYTIGLMIATLRNLAWGHAELKQGRWGTRALPHDSLMLHGKTVGLIGFGAIGQRVAALLAAFDCRVLYHRRTPPAEALRAPAPPSASPTAAPPPTPPAPTAGPGGSAEFVPLEHLLAESDVVSLHCPLNAETTGLIDRRALQSMKRHAVLINVARGGIVNEADLVWALSNKLILGAATDVYDVEPLPADSALLALDNLVVSPHLAGIAADNFTPTVSRILANIARTERGDPLPEHDRVVP